MYAWICAFCMYMCNTYNSVFTYYRCICICVMSVRGIPHVTSMYCKLNISYKNTNKYVLFAEFRVKFRYIVNEYNFFFLLKFHENSYRHVYNASSVLFFLLPQNEWSSPQYDSSTVLRMSERDVNSSSSCYRREFKKHTLSSTHWLNHSCIRSFIQI